MAASAGGRGARGHCSRALVELNGGPASGGLRSGLALGAASPWEREGRPSDRSWGWSSVGLWGREALHEGAGD